MVVENDTDEIRTLRSNLIEMLLVEGNHFCMFCEKSGNCELQALAYRLGITAPKYPYLYPERKLDFSHPDIFIDHNRCILCGRCVRASKDLDNKNVFQFVGRGANKRVSVNSKAKLKGSDIDVMDKAVSNCPVGALLPKRTGYKVPIGERRYDAQPIGSDIEKSAVK
jgi:[NiFe] hydrogenase diaphorase moiety small subunit